MSAADTEDLGIEGVALIPLPVFADERGAVYRMLRRDDQHFRGFGEIYFSTVLRGVVKAWKRHRSLTASYVCIHGKVRMVLYDARPHCASRGKVAQVLLGPHAHRLLVVPPGIWNGFMGLEEPVSIVANLASEPYDPAEFERCDPGAEDIPYRWQGPPVGSRSESSA